MVSAWATETNLVLGQVKTEEESNEITAIPELLNLLDVSGCVVTIDAMGCQKKIAEQMERIFDDSYGGVRKREGRKTFSRTPMLYWQHSEITIGKEKKQAELR